MAFQNICQYVNRQDLDAVIPGKIVEEQRTRNTTRNTKSVDAAHKK
jgi:hypothetical protein